MRDRSITHRLAKMSFDGIFDLTAGMYFLFFFSQFFFNNIQSTVIPNPKEASTNRVRV